MTDLRDRQTNNGDKQTPLSGDKQVEIQKTNRPMPQTNSNRDIDIGDKHTQKYRRQTDI